MTGYLKRWKSLSRHVPDQSSLTTMANKPKGHIRTGFVHLMFAFFPVFFLELSFVVLNWPSFACNLPMSLRLTSTHQEERRNRLLCMWPTWRVGWASPGNQRWSGKPGKWLQRSAAGRRISAPQWGRSSRKSYWSSRRSCCHWDLPLLQHKTWKHSKKWHVRVFTVQKRWQRRTWTCWYLGGCWNRAPEALHPWSHHQKSPERGCCLHLPPPPHQYCCWAIREKNHTLDFWKPKTT